MSFRDHISADGKWMKLLDAFKGIAVGHGSGNNYGMHVSVNRAALDRNHSARLVVFINRNPGLCCAVGRRENPRYANFFPSIDWDEATWETTDKYRAISQRSSRRLEVRFFRTTIDPNQFRINMEFVDSMVEFTRAILQVDKLTDEEYITWMESKKESYPKLHNFLFRKLASGVISPRASGQLAAV